jgi:hypothetical protein
VSDDAAFFLGYERNRHITRVNQIINELRLGDSTEGGRDDLIDGVFVGSLRIAYDHQWTLPTSRAIRLTPDRSCTATGANLAFGARAGQRQ